jgi:hypothetical protein
MVLLQESVGSVAQDFKPLNDGVTRFLIMFYNRLAQQGEKGVTIKVHSEEVNR